MENSSEVVGDFLPTMTHIKDFTEEFSLTATTVAENVSSGEGSMAGMAPLVSSTVTNSLVIAFGCASIFVILVNILLLVSSKFASGGRTPVLIFVRSLCVADTLTGVFGILKMTQVLMTWTWTNCFLPESLLFSATIAFNLTQVMLTTMCYSMLKDVLHFDQKQDKQRSIFSMTFIWNGSFIVGFVPHMDWNGRAWGVETRYGWNSSGHICLFLKYFSKVYISFVTFVIGVSLIWLIVVNVALQVLISHRRIRDPTLLTLAWPVIRGTRVDVILQVICYLPGTLYMFVPCKQCAYEAHPLVANANLWLFMSLMVFRAMCSTALHVTRTPQIREVVAHVVKLCQHQVMMSLGMSIAAERPVRASPSISFIQTEPKSIASLGGNGVAPPLPRRYSWREEIKDRLTSNGHQRLAPRASSSNTDLHPTIPEEPSIINSSTDQGETEFATPQFSSTQSSAPSRSTSNVTLMSALGSMQSSSSTTSTASPTSSRKASTKSRDLNMNGLHRSASASSKLQYERETSRQAGTSYWSGSLPRRTSLSLTSQSPSGGFLEEPSANSDNSILLSPQRHLLWAASPSASRMTSSISALTSSPQRFGKTGKKEALNNDTKPTRFHESNNEVPVRTNTVQSEVVVHVPADA